MYGFHKNHPCEDSLKTVPSAKSRHTWIGATLSMLKICLRSLNMQLKSSYRIKKKLKRLVCWPASCQPAIRPVVLGLGLQFFSQDLCLIGQLTNCPFQRRFVYCTMFPPFIVHYLPFFFSIHSMKAKNS